MFVRYLLGPHIYSTGRAVGVYYICLDLCIYNIYIEREREKKKERERKRERERERERFF